MALSMLVILRGMFRKNLLVPVTPRERVQDCSNAEDLAYAC